MHGQRFGVLLASLLAMAAVVGAALLIGFDFADVGVAAPAVSQVNSAAAVKGEQP